MGNSVNNNDVYSDSNSTDCYIQCYQHLLVAAYMQTSTTMLMFIVSAVVFPVAPYSRDCVRQGCSMGHDGQCGSVG